MRDAAVSSAPARGPLAGLRIIELASVGPVTFVGMLLANLGANVVRVNRPASAAGVADTGGDPLAAGRPSIAIDLRLDAGREAFLELCERADALIEGMRSGVMERLGVGPDACLGRNGRLVFGRISGYGSTGPLGRSAGHDIDYLALSGALWSMGDRDRRPTPPLNLVGDYGGGAMMLAFGVVAALVERQTSGRGQVVETSILEATTQLMSLFYYARAANGAWETGERRSDDASHAETMLSGQGPFYRVYETADECYIAVGAVETPFYREFVARLGLDVDDLPDRLDPASWPELSERFASVLRARTRAEWEEIFEGSDACVVPVLSPAEAPRHPQHVAMGTFASEGTGWVPNVAPDF
jgi:alpha-methylacyl-CoA racemase